MHLLRPNACQLRGPRGGIAAGRATQAAGTGVHLPAGVRRTPGSGGAVAKRRWRSP